MEEVKKFAEAIQPYWAVVEPVLTIHSTADYERALDRLNQLIDKVGTDENHPLYGLLDTLGTVIHAYEEDNVNMPQQARTQCAPDSCTGRALQCFAGRIYKTSRSNPKAATVNGQNTTVRD